MLPLTILEVYHPSYRRLRAKLENDAKKILSGFLQQWPGELCQLAPEIYSTETGLWERSVTKDTSGGTKKRTGKILVPIPLLTNKFLPSSTMCPMA